MPNAEARLRGPSEADVARADKVQELVVSGIIPGLREHLTHWRKGFSSKLGLGIGGVFGLLSVACGSGAPAVSPTETPKISTPTPEQPIPTPVPTETPTATPTKQPEATATVEPTPEPKVETVPCAILPPEYCSQAERIQITRNGRTITYLAFNLPPDVPVFAPEDGRILDILKESGDPFSGFRAIIRKPGPDGNTYSGTGYIFTGDLRFDTMPTKSMPQQKANPKKGSIIGHSNTTGTKNLGASLLFTITKATPQGGITNEAMLQELFPAAFEKPIKQTFTQQTPGIPNVSIHYGSKPPQ